MEVVALTNSMSWQRSPSASTDTTLEIRVSTSVLFEHRVRLAACIAMQVTWSCYRNSSNSNSKRNRNRNRGVATVRSRRPARRSFEQFLQLMLHCSNFRAIYPSMESDLAQLMPHVHSQCRHAQSSDESWGGRVINNTLLPNHHFAGDEQPRKEVFT